MLVKRLKFQTAKKALYLSCSLFSADIKTN